jgi:hypothetical protein
MKKYSQIVLHKTAGLTKKINKKDTKMSFKF